MIQKIIAEIMTYITSWLLSKGLEYMHSKEKKAQTDSDIDKKLSKFKEAYKEMFDGQKITIEQRQKLNEAVRDFIRGDSNSGGV